MHFFNLKTLVAAVAFVATTAQAAPAASEYQGTSLSTPLRERIVYDQNPAINLDKRQNGICGGVAEVNQCSQNQPGTGWCSALWYSYMIWNGTTYRNTKIIGDSHTAENPCGVAFAGLTLTCSNNNDYWSKPKGQVFGNFSFLNCRRVTGGAGQCRDRIPGLLLSYTFGRQWTCGA